MSRIRWSAALLGAVVALMICTSARATTYAPVNAPGPALTVPSASLASALSCHGDLGGSLHEPILLAPVDLLTTYEFSFNWEPALQQQDWPYCTIELPEAGLADMQTSGQYLVYAIRSMHAMAHQKIDVVGHSMGAILARWALRFWPGTRSMVDDLIGIAAPNHGAEFSNLACPLTRCPASYWQQAAGSAWIDALNSQAGDVPRHLLHRHLHGYGRDHPRRRRPGRVIDPAGRWQ